MSNSLRVLLSDSVDYAGIFPPASLDLETAVRNYAKYRDSPDSWLLGRFVCPLSRLPELNELVEPMTAGGAVAISALGTPGDSLFEIGNQIRADFAMMAAFHAANAQINFASIELKLPRIGDADEANLNHFIDTVGTAAYAPRRKSEFKIFLEVATADAAALAERIADTMYANIGLKIRAGGKEVSISSKEIADFIVACVRHNTFFKATAGLHHLLSHKHDGQWQCGFLNLFVAAAISQQDLLQPAEVLEILAATNLDQFEFGADAIGWKNQKIANDRIGESRKHALLSFGSCSFDEPLNELKQFDLL